MPRQVRLEYPGAVYHVVNRGDRREEIFRDAPDRERLVHRLFSRWAFARTAWRDGGSLRR